MTSEMPGAPIEPSTRRPGKRRRWILVLGALLALGIILGFFVPTVLSTSVGRGWILKRVEEKIGASVSADSISLAWSGEQHLTGLRVRSPSGSGADVVTLKEGILKVGLLRLALSSPAELVLELEEPVIHVVRSKDGRFNFEGIGGTSGNPAQKPGDAGATPREIPPVRRDKKLPRLELPRELLVQVRGGSLHYRDEIEATAADVSDLGARISGGPGRLDLAIQAKWSVGDSPGSAAALEAHLAAREDDIEASLDTGALDLRPLRGLVSHYLDVELPDGASRARLKASTQRGVVTFEANIEVDDSRGRSTVTSSGTLQAGEEGQRLKALASLDLSLAAALAWAKGFVPEGLQISPKGSVRFKDAVVEGLIPTGGAPALEGLVASGMLLFDGSATWKGWGLEALKADLRAEKGVLSVDGAECAVNGGKAVVESLSADVRQVPLVLLGKAHMEGIAVNYEMSELLAYVVPFLAFEDRQAVFTGKLAGTLDISARGLDPTALERDLAGKGALRITDGQLSASPVFREAAKLLKTDLSQVLFSELGSDFTIGHGKVDATRVFLNGKPGSKIRNLGLRGVTRFDRSIDYGVDLSQLEETVGDKKIRKVLGNASKLLAGGVFPLKLRGTLSKPTLELDPELNPDKLIEGVKDLPVDEILELFGGRKKKPKK